MKRIIIFSVIFIVAISAGIVSIQSPEPVHIGTFAKFLPKVQFVSPEIKPDSVGFVGDIFLGRRVETYLDTYGSDYVYSNLPKLGTSTLLVGNFEASIPTKHVQTPELTFSFSVDQKYIEALSGYGFTHMGLSNNHSFDKGEDDFKNTQKVLSENNLVSFGNPSELSTSSITYLELDGYTVALIGLYAIETQPDETIVRALFELAENRSDLQIAYVHWGVEYASSHSKVQQHLAYMLVDAGADVVFGHHPHVVQDIELFNGVPIFYSLGNFIFDQYFSDEVQEGLWVELTMHDDFPSFVLKGVTSMGSRSVPRLMPAYENDIFLKKLAKKSSPALTSMIQSGLIELEK